MNALRQTFLDTAAIGRDLVADDAVGRRWDEPSALAKFSVRGLAGHLVRATTSVTAYLDREEPDAAAITAAEYYARAVAEPDIESDLHRSIRSRGETEAEGGQTALVERLDHNLTRLRDDLEREPENRLVDVYAGMVLRLDDYLVTRIIELVVHIDDLAVSIDVPVPDLPERAGDVAIRALVDIARFKHGDIAVLRALSRRERDDVNALRVL